MDLEKTFIQIVDEIMPRSNLRLSKCFENDAELVNFNGQKLLFTIDDFSSEDQFRENDPYTLGWNIAVAAISDILAAGGIPIFYSHSMVINNKWNLNFTKSFSRGVADVLKKLDMTFIGGDFGKSKEWKYSAAVIGKPGERVINRKGAQPNDIIYISGRIGAGNLEAALNIYSKDKKIAMLAGTIKNSFKIRSKEAQLMRKYASSCIDTSDGVFNALNTISEINNVGYSVSEIAYDVTAKTLLKFMSLPKELLFLGECGEYELLFTVRAGDEKKLIMESQKSGLKLRRIGKIVKDPSTKELIDRKKVYRLDKLKSKARNYDSVKEYLQVLTEFLRGQNAK